MPSTRRNEGAVTEPLPADWTAALRAQGVAEAEIAEARAAARRLAAAADAHPHDPLRGVDPGAFAAFLRGCDG